MNFAMLGNTDDVLNHLQEGSMSNNLWLKRKTKNLSFSVKAKKKS